MQNTLYPSIASWSVLLFGILTSSTLMNCSPARADESAAAKSLNELLAAEWEYALRESPTFAS